LRVEVTHEEGTVTSYSHLSRIDVSEGEVLAQGHVVGAVGSTGNSTGPHLHLELRPAGGVPVDPVQALLAHGVAL
jgi:murein DD-endopeptidase MepM/ murein hydrolase activator NlpD